MQVDNLIFCIEMPILRDLPPPEESVIVPLRWESRFQLESTEYELAKTTFTAKNRGYQALLEESALWFQEYAKNHDEVIAGYNSHLSFHAILTAKTIAHIIRSNLRHFQPRKVWVPTGCMNGAALIDGQEWEGFYSFCAALRYIVLREIVAHSPVYTFHEHQKKEAAPYGTIRGLSKAEASLFIAKSVLWATRKVLTDRDEALNREELHRSLHIIGQRHKSVRLLDALIKERSPYIYLTEIPVQGPKSELRISHQIASARALQTYLNFRDQNLKEIEPQVRAWSKQIKVGLLTTHECDPKTRLALDESLKRGLLAAFFPEGIANYRCSLKQLYEPWMWNNPKVIRFTVSNYVSQYLSEHSKSMSIITSGYFAKNESCIATQMSRLLRLFRVGTKIRILVSLDLYRSNSYLWEEYQYQSTLKLLETLSSLKHKVLVKGRHAHMNALLAKRFPKLKFYNYVPWYFLAQMSDVVIHSDSSIGLEALSIGKPVIVWKPFDYPMYSDAYSDVPTDVVRKVTRGADLETAIEELVQSPKKDFDKYEHFLAHEHHRVIDWAKNAARRPLVT